MKMINDNKIYGIIGAVIGDIAGSRFEFVKEPPKKSFKLFGADSTFTDDSVLTIAIADALLHHKSFAEALWTWGKKYPSAGFGHSFRGWLKEKDWSIQNNSAGNGSGMRISAVGFRGKSLDDVMKMAEEATIPTHNSVEGIKAAQAIATSIFLARTGKTKAEIKQYVESEFEYNLDLSVEEIRSKSGITGYNQELAKYTTPDAIIAFLSGNDYEDVIRTAITYGNDTDTVACMAGAIAAAYYGVPVELAEQAAYCIPKELLDVINEFDGTQLSNHRVTPPNVRRWSADTIVVYGSNADDTDGEKGFSNTHISRFNHYPLSGYPICTIGASMDVIKKDVEGLINKVLSQPQKTFVIENVGISKKTNLGVETMAPLFEPLTDVGNVYFVKEYWDYYQSR